MKPEAADETQTAYEIETARFREVLAKGRSSNQLALFDLLVERSRDRRSPKEVELAIALFGNDAMLDSTAGSGVRVYVHRLRKRIDDYYHGKEGPRLVIPKGVYRIVLQDGEATDSDADLPAWLRRLIGLPPALSIGLVLIACACVAFIGWSLWSTASISTASKSGSRQALLGDAAKLSKPLIAVGDSRLLAETPDQRSIRRMILNPEVQTRDDFSEYLKAHPESFYELFDFDLNFAPIGSVEAAWTVQDRLGLTGGATGETGQLVPVSALSADLLESHDIIYVGRLSQLGILESRVFAQSRFRPEGYDGLVDVAKRRKFQGQVYRGEGSASAKDYGYLAVRTGSSGRRMIVLAGIGDSGTNAIVDLMKTPHVISALKRKIGGARNFEALFEVTGSSGAPSQKRLVSVHALN